MYNYFNFYFCDCVEQVLDSILPKNYAKQKFSFLIKNKNRFSINFLKNWYIIYKIKIQIFCFMSTKGSYHLLYNTKMKKF